MYNDGFWAGYYHQEWDLQVIIDSTTKMSVQGAAVAKSNQNSRNFEEGLAITTGNVFMPLENPLCTCTLETECNLVPWFQKEHSRIRRGATREQNNQRHGMTFLKSNNKIYKDSST